MTGDALAAVILLCDRRGTVRRVLANGLEAGDRPRVGTAFADVVDPASRGQAAALLSAVGDETAAFERELTAPVRGVPERLHFIAAAAADRVAIVGARSAATAYAACDELGRADDGQLALLGAALARRPRPLMTRTADEVCDDLMRLNGELLTAQRELARSNARLAALNEEKNRLLGMAAHDLRSPLGAIETYSQVLLEAAAGAGAEQVEMLTVIRDSSRFMLGLIDELLDVSRIEAGKLRLDRQPVDLTALVARSATINRALAARKSIALTWGCEAALPPVDVDPAKIEQVLNNLVSNAIKFSHPQSVVEIELRRAGDELVLAVRDQGPGIPAAEHGKLFRPFERTSVQPTAGEPSSGLGLAIVQRIVTGHGGRIWVDSEVGKGSTFSVALPLTAGTAPAVGYDAARSARRLRVVFADDDPVNRRLLTRQLEQLGHVATVVGSGREAVAACQAAAVDLVLMDVEMPGMDGCAAAAAIRAGEAAGGARLPILALSSHDDEQHRERCRLAGMDGYLTKPVRAEALRAAIDRAVPTDAPPARS